VCVGGGGEREANTNANVKWCLWSKCLAKSSTVQSSMKGLTAAPGRGGGSSLTVLGKGRTQLGRRVMRHSMSQGQEMLCGQGRS
jgi:hypothetical protein